MVSKHTLERFVSHNCSFTSQVFVKLTPHQGLELSKKFNALVQADSQFEVVAPPSLALTVFRLLPPSDSGVDKSDLEAVNQLNKIYHHRLHDADLFLTQTDVNGMFTMRLAVGSTRTEEEHIQRAFEIMVKEAGSAVEEWKKVRETCN